MSDPATIQDIEGIVQNVFHIILQGVGIIAFIMLLLGGFKYLTSGGNPEKTKAAQNTITYAILGLVLAIIVWFILLFIENFTGVKVTEFKIVQ